MQIQSLIVVKKNTDKSKNIVKESKNIVNKGTGAGGAKTNGKI